MDAVAPQPQSGPAPRYLYVTNLRCTGRLDPELWQISRKAPGTTRFWSPTVGILAQPLRPLCEGVA